MNNGFVETLPGLSLFLFRRTPLRDTPGDDTPPYACAPILRQVDVLRFL
jgi:hypothetical protein